MRHLFTLEPARESGRSGAFFNIKHLCHLALKKTCWLYQDLAVQTKTLLTDSIPVFLHHWSSCNLVYLAASLAHFLVPFSVLLDFDQYGELLFFFLSSLPFDLLYFDLVLNSESPCDLSYHYLNASVYPQSYNMINSIHLLPPARILSL